MDVVADASEFDELSNEEADEFAESQEELIGDVPKLEYNQFAGSALDELLSKERKLGFRKHVIEERPNFLHKLRVAIDIFLNEPTSSILARIWSLFILLLIIVSILLVIIQSWPSFQKEEEPSVTIFFSIETFIVAVFTFEYVSRFMMTFENRLRWIINPFNIIDLLAIAPYYIQLVIVVIFGLNFDSSWLVVVRVIRLVRIFRILKLGRFITTFYVVVEAFIHSIAAFTQLLLFLAIGLVVFSSLIYYAEQTESEFHDDTEEWIYTDDSNDPGKLSPYQSIPHSVWWSIVTMTTVGYGDTFPITPTGKLVAGFTMIFGLLLLAFPVGVLGTQFAEQFKKTEDVLATQRVIRDHGNKTIESKLSTIRKELDSFQQILTEFDSGRHDLEGRSHEMLSRCGKIRETL